MTLAGWDASRAFRFLMAGEALALRRRAPGAWRPGGSPIAYTAHRARVG